MVPRAQGYLFCSGVAVRLPPFSPLSAAGRPLRHPPRHPPRPLLPQHLGCSSMPLAEVRPSLGFCQIQLGPEPAGGRRTWGRRRHPPARSGRPPLQPGWEVAKTVIQGVGRGEGLRGDGGGPGLCQGFHHGAKA